MTQHAPDIVMIGEGLRLYEIGLLERELELRPAEARRWLADLGVTLERPGGGGEYVNLAALEVAVLLHGLPADIRAAFLADQRFLLEFMERIGKTYRGMRRATTLEYLRNAAGVMSPRAAAKPHAHRYPGRLPAAVRAAVQQPTDRRLRRGGSPQSSEFGPDPLDKLGGPEYTEV